MGWNEDGADAACHLGALEVVPMGLGYIETHGHKIVGALCGGLGGHGESIRESQACQ